MSNAEWSAQRTMIELAAERAHQQYIQQQQAYMAALQQGQINPNRKLDIYERTQLALVQLQTLYLLGDLEKQELRNATKMAMSLDRENLTVVEEIIKSKL